MRNSIHASVTMVPTESSGGARTEMFIHTCKVMFLFIFCGFLSNSIATSDAQMSSTGSGCSVLAAHAHTPFFLPLRLPLLPDDNALTGVAAWM